MRRYLTPTEKLAMLQAQGWLCGCGCGRPVWPGGPVEYDHTCPVALGNHSKPDRALAPFCHRSKTAADVRQIRKADRQRLKAEYHAMMMEKDRVANIRMERIKRKLQGRGFAGWRNMKGEVVWR